MSKPIYEDPAGRTGAYYHRSLGEAQACVALGVTEEEYLGRCGGRASNPKYGLWMKLRSQYISQHHVSAAGGLLREGQ